LKELPFCGHLHPGTLCLAAKAAPYLQLLLAASGWFLFGGLRGCLPPVRTQARFSLCVLQQQHEPARSLTFSRCFFHQPPISALMEFAFPAFLALSSLEQVSLQRCL